MTNYEIYKQRLRVEFEHTCVYCGIREPELGGAQSFHIDHYKPKNKFPHLEKEYSNMLYSCRDCNQYKSDYWPNLFEQLLKKIVLNPRNDKFQDHIEKDDVHWKGKTSRGEWNLELFRLNSMIRINQRENRINIENTIKRLYKIKEEGFSRLLEGTENVGKLRELQKDIFAIEQEISTLHQKIYGPKD